MFLFRYILMAVLAVSLKPAYADLMVAPTHVVMNLDHPRTESILVINNNPTRVKVSVEAIYNDIKDLKHLAGAVPRQDDLSPYIKISPKVIRIEAGRGRYVRIAVHPGPELKGKKGEYRAHLLFKIIEQERHKKDEKVKEKMLTLSGQIQVNVAIPVYGSIGEGGPNMDAICRMDGRDTKVTITNSGLWRFDGWLRLYDPSNKENKPAAEERIFMPRESIKNITMKFAPQSGKQYDLKWDYVDQEDNDPASSNQLPSGKCTFVAADNAAAQ
jgi:P pilus assembly chaperone PapD